MASKEYLEHFGKIGMHWGKRKGKNTTPSSEDHVTKEKLKTKPMHEMSNKELQTITARIQLEKQYSELTKKQVNKGLKFVYDYTLKPLKEITGSILRDMVKAQIQKNINYIIPR